MTANDSTGADGNDLGDDFDATPDELLLELMDLVALAFPEPLRDMTITFVESEIKKRPALSNLDGIALPGQAKRPKLGHDDGHVLDAINELITDFADATMRQGGVRALAGRIEVKGGPDGDRFVALHDDAHPGEPMMTRRFDASELRWLFWTAPLFRALAETEEKEREQKAAVDADLLMLTTFQIDMARGEITFSAQSQVPATYSFALLGSWLDETKRFMWGWANEQVASGLRADVDKLRLASTEAGLRALTEATFGCPEACAERLCRHAAARIDSCFGVYRAPFTASQGKGVMYVALKR